MDPLDSVATVPTIGLSLVIGILTLIFRRTVEIAVPSLSKKTAPTKEQQFWEKLILPVTPILMCVLFCTLVSPDHFDYPQAAEKSTVSRLIYSIVVGWFSTTTYSVVTFVLLRKWNLPAPFIANVSKTGDAKAVIQAESNATPSDPPPVDPNC